MGEDVGYNTSTAQLGLGAELGIIEESQIEPMFNTAVHVFESHKTNPYHKSSIDFLGLAYSLQSFSYYTL